MPGIGYTTSTTASSSSNMQYGYCGGCFVDGNATCVEEPRSDCDEGTYVSPIHLLLYGNPKLGHCVYNRLGNDAPKSHLGDVTIGRCQDGDKSCTNDVSSCKNETTSFLEDDPTCTIACDLARMSPTIYGSCNSRCVWSKEDCDAVENDYVSHDPNCTADKIEIGACVCNGVVVCALSPQSCQSSEHIVASNETSDIVSYWSHQETRDRKGINCVLASLPSPDPPPTLLPKETEPPTMYLLDQNSQLFNKSISSSGQTTKNAVIITTVAIIALIVGNLIGFAFMRCIGKKEKKRNSNNNSWRISNIHNNLDDDDDDPEIPSAIYSKDDVLPVSEYAASQTSNES